MTSSYHHFLYYHVKKTWSKKTPAILECASIGLCVKKGNLHVGIWNPCSLFPLPCLASKALTEKTKRPDIYNPTADPSAKEMGAGWRYRAPKKCVYVVARNFFLLLLNCSAWTCLGPAYQDLHTFFGSTVQCPAKRGKAERTSSRNLFFMFSGENLKTWNLLEIKV